MDTLRSLIAALAISLLLAQSATAVDPHGDVLLVPGLNNRPEIMEPLAEAFAKRKFNPVIVRLTGHQTGQSLDSISADDWRRDLLAAYNSLKDNRRFAVGYSLGAALILDAAKDKATIRFDRAVLLAPAIRFTWRAVPLRMLLPLRLFGFSLPSRTPERLRAHDRTPLAAYQAAAEIADGLGASQFGGIPIRVIVSPDDELVSIGKLKNWARRQGLEHWEYLEPPKHYGQRHMIIDPELYTREAWDEFVDQIAGFLSETAPLALEEPKPKRPN